MTIKEAQELIETWTAKNNVRNNELTRVMVRRFNDHANEPNFRYEVSDEIGDILWALVNVANQTGVDLTVSLINALERKSNQQSHLSSPKKK